MKVLVTGATGFVGNAVIRKLAEQNDVQVIAAVRNQVSNLSDYITQVMVEGLSSTTDYGNIFDNVDVVIHVAARVHVMEDHASDPLTEFRKVNVEGTLNLARQAVNAGVKRFVFISSIKVNGENTYGMSFAPDDNVNTTDPYGQSKREAEQDLRRMAEKTGLEVVIIRPPLVYGPNVKANFLKLIQTVRKGVPLPLGAVHNQRSLVALDNLADFIALCTYHPKAANQTFLISDGEDVSTTKLLQKVGKALDKPARLIPVPVNLMRLAAKLVGKGAVADRLFDSLQVDSSKARALLGWKPVITMDEELKKTVAALK